ncbi:MAG: acetyl-CoA carboxylase biotin carboxylase subunit [Deltaproteobacteria bacterium]|nr:acetyl-CoA carboxylase biotin carboxylase subunit [Deltaproteobacteria bacterium]
MFSALSSRTPRSFSRAAVNPRVSVSSIQNLRPAQHTARPGQPPEPRAARRVVDRRTAIVCGYARDPARRLALRPRAPRATSQRVLRRVLIANRGEIARRVIRACRDLGVETVAVYSEADAGAPFVREADAAFPIGPSPARDSYLNAPALLVALKESGADAVHPGYGFLSENAAFADAVRDAGAIFVGPPASAIRAMGDKAAARRLMREAGVPVTPGTGLLGDADAAVAAAETLGYPVMVKASAGGGGIGMVPCEDEAQLRRGFASAVGRAQASFGNGAVYLERLVHGARHVEIQIAADAHGAVVHLFERECSVQRRHQKVIEEAPAPNLAPAVRDAMGDAALRAARAIGYRNVGTLEFLLAPSGEFYFMEMNTRLQVEHPVTEWTTGVDLVQLQLRLAAGEPLGLAQADLAQTGHAIELRLYAEDPARGFLPSPGEVTRLVWPSGADVRVDAGIEQGSKVTPFYDPLLAKLIVRGETREAAIGRGREALRTLSVEGVKTNAPLLARVLADPAFFRGEVSIHYLSRLLEQKQG